MVRGLIPVLFHHFGIMWVVIIVILVIRLFDVITGKPLEQLFSFGGLLNTEHYPSLWARYHDRNFLKYKEERAWVYNNYKAYLRRAVREQGITTWRNMLWARRTWCYQILYNLMIDLDNEDDYIKGGYYHHGVKGKIRK